MRPAQHRTHYRLQTHRSGLVRQGSRTAPCTITELTPDGIGLTSALDVAPGDRIELEFPLTPGCILRCELLVKHAAPPRIGGRIAAIAPEPLQQLRRYVEQRAAASVAPL